MGPEERTDLPDVPDEVVDRIERRVFAQIAQEQQTAPARQTSRGHRAARPGDPATPRARRRRAGVLVVSAAAAAVVLGGVLTPALLSGAGPAEVASDTSADSGAVSADAPEAAVPDSPTAQAATQEIVTTGTAALVVADVPAAAEAVGALAEERGGRVEGMHVSQADADVPADGWITLRVPAAELDDLVDALVDVGRVEETTLSTEDVTSQALDLRARIAAAEASVARLTELLAQSGDVDALLEAEQSLSERQAELEAYRSQLEDVEGRVALSTLEVTLSEEAQTAVPGSAGFGDGLVAGWNGLVAVLGGATVAVGFALPWAGVLVAAAGIVWAAVAVRRRRLPRRNTV